MRGELHELVDTLVVKAANTLVGGCAVWADSTPQAVDDAASGQTTYPVGIALFDAAAGETASVGRRGIYKALATNAETIEAGDFVMVNATTGKWELADIATDDANGRAWSATTGGNGEYFECEIFQVPLRAEPA